MGDHANPQRHTDIGPENNSSSGFILTSILFTNTNNQAYMLTLFWPPEKQQTGDLR